MCYTSGVLNEQARERPDAVKPGAGWGVLTSMEASFIVRMLS
jgi:hypothetical protein